MTPRLTINYAKNYCNRTLIVKVILENVVTCFLLGHSAVCCEAVRSAVLSIAWLLVLHLFPGVYFTSLITSLTVTVEVSRDPQVAGGLTAHSDFWTQRFLFTVQLKLS